MPYLGVDFGTSNCVVADFRFGRPVVLKSPEGYAATPSVVTLRRNGSLAFGLEAKEAYDEHRSLRSIKRALGHPDKVTLAGQEVRPEQVAIMLFGLLKRQAEAALKKPVSKAVITVPANSKGHARHATKVCAAAAGFQVLTLVNEPSAAAIAYGVNARQDQTVLVYDFGGGTLDVTILRVRKGIFEEIASKGIGRLGGDDADQLLAEMLADRFRKRTGYDILNSPHRSAFWSAVERAKIDLSEAETAVARRAALVPEEQLSLEEAVTRSDYERQVRPLVDRSGQALAEALHRANLTPAQIDRVLLVGGMSKTPLVQKFVADWLNKPLEKAYWVDPLTCVAEGAAVVSGILQKASGLEGHTYSVRLEHSLCACPVDEHGLPFLDPIIPRGTPIPCTLTKSYYPVADPAERVTVSVYEGDMYDEPDDPDNVHLADVPWEFHPKRRQRDGHLAVTFRYGEDGILSVTMHDPLTRETRNYAIDEASPETVSQAYVEKVREVTAEVMERTDRMEEHDVYRRAREGVRRAEQDLVPKLTDDPVREEVENLIRELREAMTAADRARMELLAGRLEEKLVGLVQPPDVLTEAASPEP